MSRGSILLFILLVLLTAAAFVLANKDISVAPIRVEKAVSADAPAK